ncbi:hypothetical protein ED28_00340 [[Pantoea] beijingensis]|uniref:Uncharacterized protein n=1 Tax=[Pantoea] beijingensis TaxID=1324864 RepID=A0A443IHF6_9GAMM|nr:hypothetical protein ED28_00340 [[Pantoea] beijingensis]
MIVLNANDEQGKTRFRLGLVAFCLSEFILRTISEMKDEGDAVLLITGGVFLHKINLPLSMNKHD